jgi:aryl-alcohol dehydrogenase-like predicted oxidoreductase
VRSGPPEELLGRHFAGRFGKLKIATKFGVRLRDRG